MKKIVFLGDIKHFFGFEFKEGSYFREFLKFLREYLDDEDIILIKGNHDTFELAGKKMRDFYVNSGIAFIHGHKDFSRIYEKDIETVVLSHLHPSVVISDKSNVKREKYKCFLVGKYKKKTTLVLPSFFEIIEGASVNDYKENYGDFSIIPKREILRFEMYVIGDKKIYDFGKVKAL